MSDVHILLSQIEAYGMVGAEPGEFMAYRLLRGVQRHRFVLRSP